MRVLLDDQLCLKDAPTIGAAIDGAAAIAEGRGRVVVEVTVDGTPWGDDELRSAERRRASAREISMVSTDLEELVCRTLEGASSALTEAEELQREAAELIQSDLRAEAMEKLGAAIEIWRFVHLAVVRSAEAYQIDVAGLRVGDAPLTDAVQRLAAQLDALRGALDGNDPVGLSDTLLYDLPDVVAEWRELLHVFQEHVERAAGGGASRRTDAE